MYVCSAVDRSVLVASKDEGGDMVTVKFGDKTIFLPRYGGRPPTLGQYQILNF